MEEQIKMPSEQKHSIQDFIDKKLKIYKPRNLDGSFDQIKKEVEEYLDNGYEMVFKEIPLPSSLLPTKAQSPVSRQAKQVL
jgi:hypothetical protein